MQMPRTVLKWAVPFVIGMAVFIDQGDFQNSQM